VCHRRIATIRLDHFDVSGKGANIIEITAIIILKAEIKRGCRNKNNKTV
jgi:hypothetical protein